jgi:hypothetical protein
MKIQIFIISFALLIVTSCSRSRNESAQNANDTAALAPASSEEISGVYFVNLKDGDKVKSPVIIQMGVHGMSIEPAGKVNEGKGHHHIIIDGSFIEKGQAVPMDKTHLHFGKGQVTDTLKLNPGGHTLTLQFADGVHASYGKDWSKTIAITVLE